MLYNAIVVIPLVGHAAKRFHLAVVHPGVGSRAVVRKESHSMPTLYLRFFFCIAGAISVSMYSLKYLMALKLLARAHNPCTCTYTTYYALRNGVLLVGTVLKRTNMT